MDDYKEKSKLATIAEKFVKSGAYTATGKDAALYFLQAAESLGIDLTKDKKYDLEKTRRILGRGTPMSQLIREMRDKSGKSLS